MFVDFLNSSDSAKCGRAAAKLQITDVIEWIGVKHMAKIVYSKHLI